MQAEILRLTQDDEHPGPRAQNGLIKPICNLVELWYNSPNPGRLAQLARAPR
jgi:hypothetical protein